MSILKDLQGANFLRDLGKGLDEYGQQLLLKNAVDEFTNALAQQKVKEDALIPRQELFDKTNAELETSGELGRDSLPDVSLNTMPGIMQQMDRLQKQISSRGDIVGKFAPTLAILGSPQLANQIAQDAMYGKQLEVAGLNNKADLLSKQEATRERELNRAMVNEDRDEARSLNWQKHLDNLQEKQYEFDNRSLERQRYWSFRIQEMRANGEKKKSDLALKATMQALSATTRLRSELLDVNTSLAKENEKFDSFATVKNYKFKTGNLTITDADFVKLQEQWKTRIKELETNQQEIKNKINSVDTGVDTYLNEIQGLQTPDVGQKPTIKSRAKEFLKNNGIASDDATVDAFLKKNPNFK